MTKYSFPKRVRLNKQKEIQAIFQDGTYQRLGFIGVKYRQTSIGYSRFVLSIKKKVGHAPARNHLKRLLREAIRLQNPELFGSYDICFFITRPPQRPVQFSWVHQQIKRFFTSLNE